MKLGLVLMAGGAGTRFGGGKADGGISRRAALSPRPFRGAGGVFRKAVAVVSAIAQLLEEGQGTGLSAGVNDRPEDGVSRTIALGLDALAQWTQPCSWRQNSPCSPPRRSSGWRRNFSPIPRPLWRRAAEGRRGNPCLFPAEFFPALCALTGDRGGAGSSAPTSSACAWWRCRPEELLDADTPEILAALSQNSR